MATKLQNYQNLGLHTSLLLYVVWWYDAELLLEAGSFSWELRWVSERNAAVTNRRGVLKFVDPWSFTYGIQCEARTANHLAKWIQSVNYRAMMSPAWSPLIKAKFTLEQATKAQRGSRVIALLFL